MSNSLFNCVLNCPKSKAGFFPFYIAFKCQCQFALHKKVCWTFHMILYHSVLSHSRNTLLAKIIVADLFLSKSIAYLHCCSPQGMGQGRGDRRSTFFLRKFLRNRDYLMEAQLGNSQKTEHHYILYLF